MKKSFKEFKHQFNKNPNFHYGLFGAVAAETIAMWYVNPWISVAVNGLGFGPIFFLLIFGQEIEAEKRKLYYDTDVYEYMALGRDFNIEDLASQNHYQEKSVEALKEQNTHYLYEALCAYHQERAQNNFSKANHYLRAAEILLKRHADSIAVIQRLKERYASNYDGLHWLEMYQSDHTTKIP